jgi:hypothetical protein
LKGADANAGRMAAVEPDEVIDALQHYKRELEGILSRFIVGHEGSITAFSITREDIPRLEQLVFELKHLFDDASVDAEEQHSKPLITRFKNNNLFGKPTRKGVEDIKSIVSAAITRAERNPQALKATDVVAKDSKDRDALVRIAERLHLVVHELWQRREDRPTLNVADEYDVQDLVHAQLRLYFDDIRPLDHCWNQTSQSHLQCGVASTPVR